MSNIKTNVMRILDGKKIEYNIITYDSSDNRIDGISVSQKINKNPRYVYKTLVAVGHSKTIYVFIVPVAEELDLKKAATAAEEKNIEMLPVKDLLKLTGYIRGGCSPIGMKKDYKTFLHSSARDIENIIVSGGKIGLQVELSTIKLIEAVNLELADIIKDA